jgi:hypothetical protein
VSACWVSVDWARAPTRVFKHRSCSSSAFTSVVSLRSPVLIVVNKSSWIDCSVLATNSGYSNPKESFPPTGESNRVRPVDQFRHRWKLFCICSTWTPDLEALISAWKGMKNKLKMGNSGIPRAAKMLALQGRAVWCRRKGVVLVGSCWLCDRFQCRICTAHGVLSNATTVVPANFCCVSYTNTPPTSYY